MKKLVLLSILLLISVAAFGGPSTSGGGFAVVCRGERGQIRSAELLDLYEGWKRFRLRPRRSIGNVEYEYTQAALNTYSLQGGPDFGMGIEASIRENLARFMKTTRMVPFSRDLPLVNDLGPVVAPPPGCALEQVAFFDDEQTRVWIAAEIWKSFPPLHQAALISHETIYFDARSALGAQTSELVRTLVAQIYAASGVVPIDQGVPAGTVSHITNNGNQRRQSDTNFWVVSDEVRAKHGVFLHFGPMFFNRPIVSQTIAFLPGIRWSLEQVHTSRGRLACRVIEAGQNRRIRAKVKNPYHPDWEIIVHYQTQRPVKLTLIEKGKPIAETFVEFCLR